MYYKSSVQVNEYCSSDSTDPKINWLELNNHQNVSVTWAYVTYQLPAWDLFSNTLS